MCKHTRVHPDAVCRREEGELLKFTSALCGDLQVAEKKDR